MNVRLLSESNRDQYTALLVSGVRACAAFFRITERDVVKSPSVFGAEGDGAFTLGGFDENNKLAGVVSFARETAEKLSHKALIYRMYVSSEYAGQGLGRALMEGAIYRATSVLGLEQVQLTVLSHNGRAKRLYQRLGFASFALEKDAVKWQGQSFDEERMVLVLPRTRP